MAGYVIVGILVGVFVYSDPLAARNETCAGEPATIVGTTGPDVINGTPGDDVIVGLGGADVIYGRAGGDLICAGYGPDIVRAGVGSDTVYAGPGHDTVLGGDGNDVLLGGNGADSLQGNTGADRVVGGNGRDRVMGGVGNDVVEGGMGRDRVTGGPGDDIVDGGGGIDACSVDDDAARCEKATATRVEQTPELPKVVVEPDQTVERVIHISIDGLRSDYVTADLMPNLSGMRLEGVSTLNARNDPLFTNTLPNHTSQVTGRPVEGSSGHGVDFNSDNGETVHEQTGNYIASVYDVVHDSGLETAAYVGKDKFEVHRRSWNAENGAQDITGADDGRAKIDIFERESPDDAAEMFLDDLSERPDLAYTFFHIRYPDGAGHGSDWGSSEYRDAVEQSDDVLGTIMDAIRSNPEWRDTTAVIVLADHGGLLGDDSHYDHELADNYTIPFVVWAPEAKAGGDLYSLNPTNRRNPGSAEIGLDGTQPVRGHEAGNLALDLLGLPPIPGSVFNADFDLALR